MQVGTMTCDIAFLLFIDPTPKDATHIRSDEDTLLNRFLNWAAKSFQPPPGVLHTELLFINHLGQCHHFATYVGDEANWQQSSEEYYKSQRWHAIPIAFGKDVSTLIQECNKCKHAPYSILRYLISTPILGWTSYLISDNYQSPAHCGGLVARIVKNSKSDMFPYPSPRYSPSDVYNSAKRRRARLITSHYAEHLHPSDAERSIMINPWVTRSDYDLLRMTKQERMDYMVEYMRDMATISKSAYTLKHTSEMGWVAARAITLHALELHLQTNALNPENCVVNSVDAVGVPSLEAVTSIEPVPLPVPVPVPVSDPVVPDCV